MIRPVSEIEYPPSEAQRTKAAMIARMEYLQRSAKGTMTAVIAKRVTEEKKSEDHREMLRHADEHEYLMETARRYHKE